MVVLIQKEVATRIVARDNKESILSISVKAFGRPKLTAKVPASAFRPAPKVDSAVLAVYDISQEQFRGWGTGNVEKGALDEIAAAKKFFTVVRAGFAHKRKLLARNLEIVAEKGEIARAFAALGLGPNTRAEDITLAEWLALSKMIY